MQIALFRALRRLRRHPAFERLRALAVLLVFVGAIVEQTVHVSSKTHLPHHRMAAGDVGEDACDSADLTAIEDVADTTGGDLDDHDPHSRADHEKQLHHGRGGTAAVAVLPDLGPFRLPPPPDERGTRPAHVDLRPPRLPDLELAEPRGPPTA